MLISHMVDIVNILATALRSQHSRNRVAHEPSPEELRGNSGRQSSEAVPLPLSALCSPGFSLTPFQIVRTI